MPTLSIPHLLRRSLLHRRARALTALVALTISAAIATALLTLYASLDAKLHHEFRSFGANIVLTQPALPSDALAEARQAAGPTATVAAFAYAVATTDRNTPVVIAGVDFPTLRKLDTYWQLPAWPTAPNAALLGEKAAAHIADEHQVTLTFAGRKAILRRRRHTSAPAATKTPASTFRAPPSKPSPAPPPQSSKSRFPAAHPPSKPPLRSLHTAFPQAQVTPVRQLVEGESNIVDTHPRPHVRRRSCSSPSPSPSRSSPPSPPRSSSAAATSPS